MNETEKSRIAAAINMLRPDWPAASLRSLLDRPQIANRPRRDVAVALAWVACETETQTPARVLEAGPWWQAAAIEGPNMAPAFERYDPTTCCDVCSKPEHRHSALDAHKFESVNAATSRRNREDTKQPIRELITTTEAGTCSGDNEGASDA